MKIEEKKKKEEEKMGSRHYRITTVIYFYIVLCSVFFIHHPVSICFENLDVLGNNLCSLSRMPLMLLEVLWLV